MTRLDPRQIVDISQDTGLVTQSRATPAKRVLSTTTTETTGSNSEVATNTTNSKTLVINYNDPPPGATPQLQIINDPGGNKYELQFNAGNSIFGATNSFTYSPVTSNVSLRGNLIVTGKISGKMTTSTTNFQIVGGDSGQVLTTDGTGNLSWANVVADLYGNSNVAAYLPTYEGNINANIITLTDTAYLYNLSSTGTSSLTTVNIGGNLTMNGGVANLGHVSKLRIDGGVEYDFLQTDGNGHVTWAALPGTPSLQEVTTTGHITNVAVQFTNNTSSINQSTGAITVTGGIGLGGNVHAQHIHAAGSMYTQDTVYSGQNAIGSSFVNPLFVGKDTGEEYVQSAMVNSNAHGSSDFAAYGESGGTDQGWTDMGYAGTEFDDPNYTITKPSDGYLFVEGMPGQGGNLVIATGDLGDATHRDIIFATGGFLTENEFARIDHANNVFHLTKAGSGIQFEDGTIQTTAGGGSNPFNQDLNTTDNVTFAQITATDVVKFTNSGGVVGAIGYAPTYVSIEGWQSNTVNITTNDINTWEFGTDGNLTLPGNVISTQPHGITIGSNYDVYIVGDRTDNNHTWKFDGSTTELILPGGVILDPSDSNFEVRGVENVNFEANTVVNIYTNTSLDGYQWQFGDDAVLTLPTITPSVGLAEISNIRSQRKIIPAYHYSAEIVGSTPTVVYTVTNSSIVTMKATMTVQHQGLGFEILDVIASTSGGDTYYTVSNRVKPPTIADTTVSVGLNGSYQMEITMTVNSGASYSWVTYDVTEFGIPVD